MNVIYRTTYRFMTRFMKPWNRWDFFYYNLPDGKRYLAAVAELHAFTEKVRGFFPQVDVSEIRFRYLSLT